MLSAPNDVDSCPPLLHACASARNLPGMLATISAFAATETATLPTTLATATALPTFGSSTVLSKASGPSTVLSTASGPSTVLSTASGPSTVLSTTFSSPAVLSSTFGPFAILSTTFSFPAKLSTTPCSSTSLPATSRLSAVLPMAADLAALATTATDTDSAVAFTHTVMVLAASDAGARVQVHCHADADSASWATHLAAATAHPQAGVDGDTVAVVAAGATRTAHQCTRVDGNADASATCHASGAAHQSAGVNADADGPAAIGDAALAAPAPDQSAGVVRDTDGAATAHLAVLAGAAAELETGVRQGVADASQHVTAGTGRTRRAGADRTWPTLAIAADHNADEFAATAHQLAGVHLNADALSPVQDAAESGPTLEQAADVHPGADYGADGLASVLNTSGADATIHADAHVDRLRELQTEHLVSADHAARFGRTPGGAARVPDGRRRVSHAYRLAVLHLASRGRGAFDQLAEADAPRPALVQHTPLSRGALRGGARVLDVDADSAVRFPHLAAQAGSAEDADTRVCWRLHRVQHAHSHAIADGAASTGRTLGLGAGVDADSLVAAHHALLVFIADEGIARVIQRLAADANRSTLAQFALAAALAVDHSAFADADSASVRDDTLGAQGAAGQRAGISQRHGLDAARPTTPHFTNPAQGAAEHGARVSDKACPDAVSLAAALYTL